MHRLSASDCWLIYYDRVMIGFAIIGPRFNPGVKSTTDPAVNDGDAEGPNLVYFKGMTLILCVSRFMLVIEYLQAMWFAREHKKVVVPMLVIAGIYFAASMTYLGLYWSFYLDADGRNHSYIAWYVVALVETLFATCVSVVWRNLSFVGTHLVERMSLLTLIILGEGAIAIAKAVQYIATSDGVLPIKGSVPAMIVCAVLNLYFMYMIYMDWIHEGLFGTIRQQIWSFLHFPLHVALVLAVEGASQSITWNAGVQAARKLIHEVEYWEDILYPANNTYANSTEFNLAADSLNATAIKLIDTQIGVSNEYKSTISGLGNLLQVNKSAIPALRNGATNPHTAGNALWWITGTLFETIFKIAGFKSPESEEDFDKNLSDDPIDFTVAGNEYQDEAWAQINKAYEVYRLTYIYFFVATGSFVLMCTILVALNRGSKTQAFWTRLVITGAIGLGLSCLACIAATEAVENYVASDWILPTVTLALFTSKCTFFGCLSELKLILRDSCRSQLGQTAATKIETKEQRALRSDSFHRRHCFQFYGVVTCAVRERGAHERGENG